MHLRNAQQSTRFMLMTDFFFSSVNLNQFRLLRVVGKGAFGKVRIVERKDSGLTFALKYIRKDEGVPKITPRRTAVPANPRHSRSVRERTEYHTRTTNVGAPQSSFPLQLAVQLPRYGVPVRHLAASWMSLRLGQVYHSRPDERR